MDWKMKIIEQLTSGRWLLTIAAAMCLGMFTIADCMAVAHGKNPIVDPSTILTIITMVFMAYFQKPTEKNGNGTQG